MVICNCLSELGWGADGDGGLSKGLMVVIKLEGESVLGAVLSISLGSCGKQLC